MTRKEVVEQAFNWSHTDKLGHGYATIYKVVPSTIKKVLEIGIGGGHSLEAWKGLFQKAEIYGLDCNGKSVDGTTCFNCDINLFKPEEHFSNDTKFDLIVDDGSHSPGDIIAGWQKLRSYCSGMYVVEDVNFNDSHNIASEMRNGGGVISIIQTTTDDGSRVVVASFDKAIQW